MKRKHIILISVLLAVLIGCAAIVYANYDFIVMIKNGFTYSEEDLKKLKDENDEMTKAVLKDLGIGSVRPLNDEEIKALDEGKITEADAVDIVLGKKSVKKDENDKILIVDNFSSAENDNKTDKPSENNKDNKGNAIGGEKNPVKKPDEQNSNNDSKTNNEKPNKNGETISVDAANEKISNLIGKLYVLKSQFEGQLAAIEAQTLAQYDALPKEKHTTASKLDLGNQGLEKAAGLEKSCDAQVESILSQIKTLLQQTNQDDSLVDSIRSAYNSEKQITKSYYVSKYR